MLICPLTANNIYFLYFRPVIEVLKDGTKDESIDVNDETTVDAKVDKDSMEVTSEDTETKHQIDTNDAHDTNDIKTAIE